MILFSLSISSALSQDSGLLFWGLQDEDQAGQGGGGEGCACPVVCCGPLVAALGVRPILNVGRKQFCLARGLCPLSSFPKESQPHSEGGERFPKADVPL